MSATATTTAANGAAAATPTNRVATHLDKTTKGREPLWLGHPLEVIGLTGEHGSGKTVFGLTIAPGPDTIVYDFEKSSLSFQPSMGFDRIDVPQEMMKKFGGKPYCPIDVYQFIRSHLLSLQPAKYRVAMIDPISDFEQGIADWIKAHPTDFGLTSNQIAKSGGLMWGRMKDLYKQILLDVATRVETFVYTTHLKSKWVGNTATNEKVPKGKETLEELAGLILWLDRSPDKKGVKPKAPSAEVLKQRLMHYRITENGLPEMSDILPPRLAIATPTAIREYIKNPYDPDKPKPGERVQAKDLTEEQRLNLQAQIAADTKEAAQAELEKIERMARGSSAQAEQLRRQSNEASKAKAEAVEANAPAEAAEEASTESNAQGDVDQPRPTSDPDRTGISEDQENQIRFLRTELVKFGLTSEQYKASLAKRGVTSALHLTVEQGDQLIANMESLLLRKKQAAAEAASAAASTTEQDSKN